jgi:hypothetical protein
MRLIATLLIASLTAGLIGYSVGFSAAARGRQKFLAPTMRVVEDDDATTTRPSTRPAGGT